MLMVIGSQSSSWRLCFCLCSVEAGEAALFLGRARTCRGLFFWGGLQYGFGEYWPAVPSCVRESLSVYGGLFSSLFAFGVRHGFGGLGSSQSMLLFLCLERSVTRSSRCESYTPHEAAWWPQCPGKDFFCRNHAKEALFEITD